MVQCDAVWCSVLQCGAVCCSVLQCVAVCCSVVYLLQQRDTSFETKKGVRIHIQCRAVEHIRLSDTLHTPVLSASLPYSRRAFSRGIHIRCRAVEHIRLSDTLH